jgi:hypothetical protein
MQRFQLVVAMILAIFGAALVLPEAAAAQSVTGTVGNNNLTGNEKSTQTQTDFVNGSSVLRLRVVLVNGAGHTQPSSEQSTYIQKNTLQVGCRNRDRSAIDYISQYWGL